MRRLFLLCLITLSPLILWGQTDSLRTQVLFDTNKGKFVIELYNETPIHRDNFIRNVRQHTYDGVTFHRVIKDFMVQTGNPMTKGSKPEDELREDEQEAKLKPEFRPDLFIHARGAVAAAREGDDANPDKLSSSTQFYIVTGKYHTDFDLAEASQNNGITYTQAQKDAYKFKGGAPHLDGAYTVFGRLLDGWGTIDKIQRVEVGNENKPLKNVIVRSTHILEAKERIQAR